MDGNRTASCRWISSSFLHDRGRLGVDSGLVLPVAAPRPSSAGLRPVAEETEGSGLLRSAESHRQLTVQVQGPGLMSPAHQQILMMLLFFSSSLRTWVSLCHETHASQSPGPADAPSPHLAACPGQCVLGCLVRSLIS